MFKLIGIALLILVAYGVALFIVYIAVDFASSSKIAQEPMTMAGIAVAAAILCLTVVFAASLP
jgi:hypothetical protein